jgi:hypothetical protein
VSERSNFNNKALRDRIILGQVPPFQSILSELWRKSSGVCENYLTWFICRQIPNSGNSDLQCTSCAEIRLRSDGGSRYALLHHQPKRKVDRTGRLPFRTRNCDLCCLIELLSQHKTYQNADVRSEPFSRFHPCLSLPLPLVMRATLANA